jgi:2'-phosphotransferase
MCIHSTYVKYLDLIKEEGLKVMDRSHIHFSPSLDSKSGKRANTDVIIYIDMEKAMNDNIIFYRSSNNVILSYGINGIIEPKYFKQIDIK